MECWLASSKERRESQFRLEGRGAERTAAGARKRRVGRRRVRCIVCFVWWCSGWRWKWCWVWLLFGFGVLTSECGMEG